MRCGQRPMCFMVVLIACALTAPAWGQMQVGTNFWFSWRGDTYTDPFVSNANFAAYPNTNPWRADFLSEIAAYPGPLRFMDWMCTNSSDQVTWSTRKSVTASDQEGVWLDPASSNNVGKGIAVEWLIDLGNRTNRDIWLCVPHKADDNYVTELARLVRSNLNTNRKCYIEYSNEVWNPGFEQNLYARQQGAARGFTGDQWEQAHRFYGYRSGQIFNIWTTEFSGQLNRIVRVLSGQNLDNTWQADVIWGQMKTSTNATPDAWSVAPYFARGDYSISAMYGSIDSEAANCAIMDTWAGTKAIKFMAYEGGQHVTTNADVRNRDPGMYDVYQYYLTKMKLYFDVFAHYGHASTFGPGGAWGAKEGIGQAESSAHKYRSIKNWVINNGATIPPAPTNLVATPGNAQVSLTWSASSGATSYNVKRSTTSGGPYSTVAPNVTGTSYNNTGLTNGTTYYYVVTAVNSAGESGNSNQASATPTGGSITVPAGTVTIDSTIDSAWSSSTARSISNISGTISSTSDCSGTWKALWDNTNLYVLVEVTDDNKSNDSTDPWADDSVEVYVDGNNNKTTTYDSNDRQYVFGWNDSTVVEGGGRSATGVTFSKVDSSSTAYRIELKIPWSTLGVTASTNKLVGLDVHINDDDAGGAREGKRMWNDTTDTAWSNPSRFGTVTLTGTPGGGGGTWTLNPTADKSGQGDTGTDITPPVSQWAHYHLKFSTSAVTGTVSNAKLRVYRNETGAGSITLYASQSVGNSDSWTEGGTVPGAGTQITSVANQNSVAYVEFDVTSFVSSQVTGDDVVTLVVTTSSGTWTRVNSRENASNKPQLVITSN